MAVGALQSRLPLTDLVFRSAWVTSHPPHQNPEVTGGGAGLVADGPTLKNPITQYFQQKLARAVLVGKLGGEEVWIASINFQMTFLDPEKNVQGY